MKQSNHVTSTTKTFIEIMTFICSSIFFEILIRDIYTNYQFEKKFKIKLKTKTWNSSQIEPYEKHQYGH